MEKIGDYVIIRYRILRVMSYNTFHRNISVHTQRVCPINLSREISLFLVYSSSKRKEKIFRI